MKIFRLSNNDGSDLRVDNKLVRLGKWFYGIEPIRLNSKDHILSISSNNKFINTYTIKKKIQFMDLKSLLEDISKSKICSFKSKKSSKVIKIYLDNKVYYTRSKGRLKLKNGKFKTNLDWLRTELIDRGLEDITPENYE